MHEERWDGEVWLGILPDGAFIHALESERHGIAVFSGQNHLPHSRKIIGDVWSLHGLPRHEQAFMVEKNSLSVRIAHQFDRHRSIAGDVILAHELAGRDAAKTPQRHNLSPHPFRQRHR